MIGAWPPWRRWLTARRLRRHALREGGPPPPDLLQRLRADIPLRPPVAGASAGSGRRRGAARRPWALAASLAAAAIAVVIGLRVRENLASPAAAYREPSGIAGSDEGKASAAAKQDWLRPSAREAAPAGATPGFLGRRAGLTGPAAPVAPGPAENEAPGAGGVPTGAAGGAAPTASEPHSVESRPGAPRPSIAESRPAASAPRTAGPLRAGPPAAGPLHGAPKPPAAGPLPPVPGPPAAGPLPGLPKPPAAIPPPAAPRPPAPAAPPVVDRLADGSSGAVIAKPAPPAESDGPSATIQSYAPIAAPAPPPAAGAAAVEPAERGRQPLAPSTGADQAKRSAERRQALAKARAQGTPQAPEPAGAPAGQGAALGGLAAAAEKPATAARPWPAQAASAGAPPATLRSSFGGSTGSAFYTRLWQELMTESRLPPPESVRVEELANAFEPAGEAAAVSRPRWTVEGAPLPQAGSSSYLLRLAARGLAGRPGTAAVQVEFDPGVVASARRVGASADRSGASALFLVELRPPAAAVAQRAGAASSRGVAESAAAASSGRAAGTAGAASAQAAAENAGAASSRGAAENAGAASAREGAESAGAALPRRAADGDRVIATLRVSPRAGALAAAGGADAIVRLPARRVRLSELSRSLGPAPPALRLQGLAVQLADALAADTPASRLRLLRPLRDQARTLAAELPGEPKAAALLRLVERAAEVAGDVSDASAPP
jgi:hypothetical protein